MKPLVNLLISLIVAIWIVAIAIVSVQNATPVSLQFLSFRSIEIPVGLVLAFSVSGGIVVMSLIQPFWGIASSGRDSSQNDPDDENFLE